MITRKSSSLKIEQDSLAKLFIATKPLTTNLGNLKVNNDPELKKDQFNRSFIRFGFANGETVTITVSAGLEAELNGQVTLQKVMKDFPVYEIPAIEYERDDQNNVKRNSQGRPIAKKVMLEGGKWKLVPRVDQEGKQYVNYILAKKGISDLEAFDLGAATAAPKAVGTTA